MFNLYKDAIDQNGFMALVSNNIETTTKEQETHSRQVFAGFAIVSLAIMSVIGKGSEVLSAVATSTVI
ncbi:hypothetical protein [Pseudemcibacter aquimaris]|uniref:hypothetical protein n=1 Tax=Pseudemcibacter aquimaris TaxID=2857064 RepID=UPI002011F6DB|nr:hypothetical protein [Pseudemcibacter aquimaris]MCC3860160.1 hypothetical protein [Pseudemcibacter aquimaris]WDU57487.1 hypothetical protein KW060_09790 [Pseudemcibacter aquimaris]